MLDDLLEAIRPLLPGLVTAGVFLLSLIVLRLALRRQSIAAKLRFPSALFFCYLGLMALAVLAKLHWPAGFRALYVLALFVLALAVILAVSFAAFDLVLGRYRQIQVPKILRDILVLIVFSIAVIAVLGRQGVDLTSILTTSAVLTAVIGFALQDMLSSVISGLALQIERPFKRGDWVKFDEQEGFVLEINWRSTKLQTLHNDIVVIPNNVITRSAVINFTAPTRVHRRKLKLGLRYETPPNAAKASILRAVRSVEGVLAEPAPFVLTRSYDDFSIGYRIHFFIEDFPRKERIEDEVSTRIWYQLRRDGLGIPFPIRDINMRQITEAGEERTRQRQLERTAAALGRVPFLEPLSEEERRALAGRLRRQIFAAGEEVIRQDDEGDSFYIIASGRVDVRAGGRSVTGLGPDDYFGEMSLMTGEARTATVVAREDCECLVVDREAFAAVIRANEALVEAIVARLEERRRALQGARERAERAGEEETAEQERRTLARRIRGFFNLG
jgi:small-conductance mechanosensitive channel/CRP-like cAMP-binding protein